MGTITSSLDSRAGVGAAGKGVGAGAKKDEFEMREVQPEKKITASIGVSVYPDDALTKQALIRVADEALYIAKRNGRNQVQMAKPSGETPESVESSEAPEEISAGS